LLPLFFLLVFPPLSLHLGLVVPGLALLSLHLAVLAVELSAPGLEVLGLVVFLLLLHLAVPLPAAVLLVVDWLSVHLDVLALEPAAVERALWAPECSPVVVA
jgi:hypothetical protein